MKIYLDLIFILNFGFDFLLLLFTSLILKRNVKLTRVVLGGIIGSISIAFLFMKISSLKLFFYKFITSILMCIATFKYNNIKYTLKNITYLYINSIVLGGTLYLLNIQFSYKNIGFIFYQNKISINFILLIILSPIILYTYFKSIKDRNKYKDYYNLKVYYKNKKYNYTGFLDTGNKLKSPYTSKPIIIINKKFDIDSFSLVPINTLNNTSYLKCIKLDRIEIEKKEIYNVLACILEEEIKIDGIDCILNKQIMEDI